MLLQMVGLSFVTKIYDTNGDDIHFTDIEIGYTNPTTIYTCLWII